MQKELFALFGNGRRENISFTLNAGESVTCHFEDSGIDTVSDKYFDLKDTAKKVGIRVNQIATITHKNNKELKSPVTLGTATMNVWSSGIEWTRITVRADVDATTFEISGS